MIFPYALDSTKLDLEKSTLHSRLSAGPLNELNLHAGCWPSPSLKAGNIWYDLHDTNTPIVLKSQQPLWCLVSPSPKSNT